MACKSSTPHSRIIELMTGSTFRFQLYIVDKTWPEPIRTPLRAAIKAKNRGDFESSEANYRKSVFPLHGGREVVADLKARAIEVALSLPPSVLEPDPLLKLSGIYISLAGLLEDHRQSIQAYETLRDANDLLGPDPLSSEPSSRAAGAWAGGAKLSDTDHVRAIGLAQKLGQLALQISSSSSIRSYPTSTQDGPKTWDAAAEYHLSSALTAMLRLGLYARPANESTPVFVGRDVDLPVGEEGGGVDKRGLGVAMEALAEVYSRRGQYDLAGQLLLQAVSTLLPPGIQEPPSLQDRCQGQSSLP